MDISSYLLLGFNILPKMNITFDGKSLEVLYNQASRNDTKHFGGLLDEYDATLTAKTSHITSPKNMIGKTLIMAGETFRIISIKHGDTITSFNIVSAKKL